MMGSRRAPPARLTLSASPRTCPSSWWGWGPSSPSSSTWAPKRSRPRGACGAGRTRARLCCPRGAPVPRARCCSGGTGCWSPPSTRYGCGSARGARAGLPPCLGAVGILWQWHVPVVQVRVERWAVLGTHLPSQAMPLLSGLPRQDRLGLGGASPPQPQRTGAERCRPVCARTGCAALHVHPPHCQPVPDLHHHVPDQLAAAAQGGRRAGPCRGTQGDRGPEPVGWSSSLSLPLAEIHRHHPPGDVHQRLPLLLPHEACE